MPDYFPIMDRIPFWIFMPTIVASIAIPSYVGLWFGRRAKNNHHKSEQPVSTKVSATLALLAFTLAFTFSIASSRYDARRQLVMDEANAIDTTYRRAALLPDDIRDEVRQLLREYARIRIEATSNIASIPSALIRSAELQAQLWQQAKKLTNMDSSSWTASWYIEPLTQLSEIHNKRIGAGLHSRVPIIVWLALFIITCLSMLGMGYQSGLIGTIRLFPMAILVLAFSTIIVLILDLDRPGGGMVRVSQNALVNVHNMMQRDTSIDATTIKDSVTQP